MAHKSPVDELVDGIDAIGSILDENLPALKSRIENLTERQIDASHTIKEMSKTIGASDEALDEIKKAVHGLDDRLEEINGTIGALIRRMDQLQKSVLEMIMAADKSAEISGDSSLADTVKILEDRLKKLESNRVENNRLTDRF